MTTIREAAERCVAAVLDDIASREDLTENVESIITRCVDDEARIWLMILRFQYGWSIEECAREYDMSREQAEEAIRARSSDE